MASRADLPRRRMWAGTNPQPPPQRQRGRNAHFEPAWKSLTEAGKKAGASTEPQSGRGHPTDQPRRTATTDNTAPRIRRQVPSPPLELEADGISGSFRGLSSTPARPEQQNCHPNASDHRLHQPNVRTGPCYNSTNENTAATKSLADVFLFWMVFSSEDFMRRSKKRAAL